jgi:hypothetical protein
MWCCSPYIIDYDYEGVAAEEGEADEAEEVGVKAVEGEAEEAEEVEAELEDNINLNPMWQEEESKVPSGAGGGVAAVEVEDGEVQEGDAEEVEEVEEAIGEHLAAEGYDRHQGDLGGDGPAVVFGMKLAPVPGPLEVTSSVHGDAPASALPRWGHQACEFVWGQGPDVKLMFKKFTLEAFKFLPGRLTSEFYEATIQLSRPDGTKVREGLNLPIKLRLTLQTCSPPKEMTGVITYTPHDEYARQVAEKPSIWLTGYFSVAVLPRQPEDLVGDLGLGHGLFLLPCTGEQLAAPLPAAFTSRSIKQVIAKQSRTKQSRAKQF